MKIPESKRSKKSEIRIIAEFRGIPNGFPNLAPSIGSATPIVNIYVTGNLGFQAIALGKKLMAGHWCMQCTSPKARFLDNGTMWTMEEMVFYAKRPNIKKANRNWE